MLVISVELWPHGNRGQAEQLGSATIANTGTGTLELGDYEGQFFLKRGQKLPLRYTSSLRGFARQKGNVWELLGLMLQNREDVRGRRHK